DVRTTAGNGSIVIRTLNGDIVLNDGTAATDDTAISAHGTGNILIEAIGAGTNLTANADIFSATGHVTILVGHDITFTATADVTTGGTGTIDIVSATGSIDQHDNSRIITA